MSSPSNSRLGSAPGSASQSRRAVCPAGVDVGSIDASGRLRISGRLKEIIIRGGENIYPAEIEIRLREHPTIADAAVVDLPDPLYGETMAAALVLRPDTEPPDEQELTAWCRATLAPFKTPKQGSPFRPCR